MACLVRIQVPWLVPHFCVQLQNGQELLLKSHLVRYSKVQRHHHEMDAYSFMSGKEGTRKESLPIPGAQMPESVTGCLGWTLPKEMQIAAKCTKNCFVKSAVAVAS